jgi:1-acyl-sn-glycerol-3-phosphate acyltransferase
MSDAFRWLTYEFCAQTLTLGLTLGWSFRVAGRKNLPMSGPVLIVANHQSFMDPPTIGDACRRHITYLARKTLFENPVFAFFIRTVNAVPVDQDGIGIDGMRAILAKLQEGHAVLVFPEGSRTEDGSLQPLMPGVSLLIKRARCPIVPVGIAGAYQAYPRGAKFPMPSPLFLPPTDRAIAVSIGRPRDAKSIADLPRDEMLKVLTADIAAQLAEAEKLRRKPGR